MSAAAAAGPLRALQGSRSSLFERDLLYLFSFDADLEMRRDEIGFVPGGLRVNITSKPNRTRVYHAARESSTLGFQTVEGTVVSGVDRALIRNDDIGVLDVQLTIRTDDGALIYSEYRGIYPAGERGYRRLISRKPLLGTEFSPFKAPVYITPRYQTDSEKYRWLTQYQCVGFGEVQVIKSDIRSVTFDIYALD
ncbi:MAG TPA: DUF3237 family protein [Polyangiaceae bacterium]|jgi:hypothetical protein|nr:DUF3237 family protein [Polyangiaceae bacterium]